MLSCTVFESWTFKGIVRVYFCFIVTLSFLDSADTQTHARPCLLNSRYARLVPMIKNPSAWPNGSGGRASSTSDAEIMPTVVVRVRRLAMRYYVYLFLFCYLLCLSPFMIAWTNRTERQAQMVERST